MANDKGTIRLERLNKTFGEFKAVADLSLSIHSGEFVTLLGPSGSGKTTTLNLIAGFETPTSGHIFLGGSDVATLPPFKRNLGMVFQNYALFPHMTVFQNVAFPLKNRRMDNSRIRDRVTAVLGLVKLEGYEKRYPKMLSGGQQQRVSIARALAYEPQALLMDEPLGALDKKLREHMQIEIKRIQKKTGVTVVYVTHDQEEALNLSDRIAIINEGKIEQIGSSREIYEQPSNRFVADFIGDANILDGSILDNDGAHAKVSLLGGTSVTAFNVMNFGKGSKVHLVIRPERVRQVKQTASLDVNIRAKVMETSYIGSLIRYTVDVGAGNTIWFKEHNTGQEISHPGNMIHVGWNIMDALLMI